MLKCFFFCYLIHDIYLYITLNWEKKSSNQKWKRACGKIKKIINLSYSCWNVSDVSHLSHVLSDWRNFLTTKKALGTIKIHVKKKKNKKKSLGNCTYASSITLIWAIKKFKN